MKRVLIVDDDEQFLYLMSREFGARYRIDTQPGSMAALDAVDAGGSYDLALIDVRLKPGEPHGFALGRMLSLKLPEMLRLYVTAGEITDDDAETANGSLMRKSADLADIGARARTLLGP